MTKQEFLAQLRKGLSGLPQEEMEERLTFYSEMIEDQMEEGISETEAVAAVGSVEEVAAQAVADTPLAKIAKERIRSRGRLKAGEVLLVVLGAPIWLSLGLAVAAVVLALYISLWAVLISLWSVFVSLDVCSVVGIPVCIIFALGGKAASGMAVLAAGLVCAGLAILMFFGCRAATKGMLVYTKKMAFRIKSCVIRRGESE